MDPVSFGGVSNAIMKRLANTREFQCGDSRQVRKGRLCDEP